MTAEKKYGCLTEANILIHSPSFTFMAVTEKPMSCFGRTVTGRGATSQTSQSGKTAPLQVGAENDRPCQLCGVSYLKTPRNT
jgi:hypothetical protein